ncbi:MAG: DUF45 domain-containing protein [Clostridia bacterium]|nr:DUF45 domain-containing protein [Clostridia bacterium]
MDIIVKTERFGSVTVPVVRKKVKNVNLRVRSDGAVVVSAPVYATEKRIRAFVESKTDWIEERLIKRSDSLLPEDKSALIVNNKIRYLGHTYDVTFFVGAPKVHIAGDYFGIFSRGDPEKVLAKWWRKTAYDIFFAEIDRQYENIFKPLVKRKPDLYVRRTTSRWGSCNFVQYRINLNELLLKGDMDGIEYVVLHEMTHLLFPDHGAGFHAFLAVHMPDYRERKRRLAEINKKTI